MLPGQVPSPGVFTAPDSGLWTPSPAACPGGRWAKLSTPQKGPSPVRATRSRDPSPTSAPSAPPTSEPLHVPGPPSQLKFPSGLVPWHTWCFRILVTPSDASLVSRPLTCEFHKEETTSASSPFPKPRSLGRLQNAYRVLRSRNEHTRVRLQS